MVDLPMVMPTQPRHVEPVGLVVPGMVVAADLPGASLIRKRTGPLEHGPAKQSALYRLSRKSLLGRVFAKLASLSLGPVCSVVSMTNLLAHVRLPVFRLVFRDHGTPLSGLGVAPSALLTSALCFLWRKRLALYLDRLRRGDVRRSQRVCFSVASRCHSFALGGLRIAKSSSFPDLPLARSAIRHPLADRPPAPLPEFTDGLFDQAPSASLAFHSWYIPRLRPRINGHVARWTGHHVGSEQ